MSARGWLPDPDHELLLRAALCEPLDAVDAWRDWLAGHDLESEHPPFETYRLLPAVYLNLRRAPGDVPYLGTLRGIHRNSWVENQHRLRKALPILDALHAEGIETALLKGASLALRAYPDIGARPMHDVDVMVRRADGPRTLALFSGDGWKGRRIATATDRRLRLVSAIQLHNPELKLGVDLHFRPIAEAFGDDAEYWAAADELELHGRRTRLLSPSHELALVLAHGSRMHPEPMSQWVTDAAYALRGGGIDWDEVLRQAQRGRLVLRFRHSLAYVKRTFGLDVPTHVLEELAASDAPRFERDEYETLLGLDGRFDAHVLHRLYYRRASAGRRWPARIAGYPLYVRDVEGVRLVDVPGRFRKWSRWTRRVERRRQAVAREA